MPHTLPSGVERILALGNVLWYEENTCTTQCPLVERVLVSYTALWWRAYLCHTLPSGGERTWVIHCPLVERVLAPHTDLWWGENALQHSLPHSPVDMRPGTVPWLALCQDNVTGWDIGSWSQRHHFFSGAALSSHHKCTLSQADIRPDIILDVART